MRRGLGVRACDEASDVVAYSVREGDGHPEIRFLAHGTQCVWMPSSVSASAPSCVRSAAPLRMPLGCERFGLLVSPSGLQRLSDGVEPAVEVVVHPAHLIFETGKHVRQLGGLRLRRRGHSARISRAADREAVPTPTERRRLGVVGPNKDSCRFPHPAHKLRANDDELHISEVREQPENPHEHSVSAT